MNYTIGNTSIQITNCCNLKCKHCFLGDQTPNRYFMDLSFFQSIINTLINHNVSSFTVTGGEPLLHPQINDFIDIIGETESNYVITTNGTIFNADFFTALSRYKNITIQISLDGSCPDVHDKQRGNGCFNKLSKFIDNLKKYNIPYYFHTTLTAFNYHDCLNIARISESNNVKCSIVYVAMIGNAFETNFVKGKVCIFTND